ncbi:hypothetical protein C9374_010349 [Naegleria lovaniensis]|uniref:Uncharacterized protein n=1 Tax=Naegleria lovaniensis TaxID=51637 RepID=A0AA88KDT2_NAELO|nr:uncharacterized protein C9374_010349 [Naegleria lovaniensis]KAG2374975.1 hypothetical protein C9374_010349 [Naegleria lovaniensis]
MNPEVDTDNVEELWSELLRQLSPSTSNTINSLETENTRTQSLSSSLQHDSNRHQTQSSSQTTKVSTASSLTPRMHHGTTTPTVDDRYHHAHLQHAQQERNQAWLHAIPTIQHSQHLHQNTRASLNTTAVQQQRQDNDEWFEKLSRSTFNVIQSLTNKSSSIGGANAPPTINNTSGSTSPSSSVPFSSSSLNTASWNGATPTGNNPATTLGSSSTDVALNSSPSPAFSSSPYSAISSTTISMSTPNMSSFRSTYPMAASSSVPSERSTSRDHSAIQQHQQFPLRNDFSLTSTLNLKLQFTDAEMTLLDEYFQPLLQQTRRNSVSTSNGISSMLIGQNDVITSASTSTSWIQQRSTSPQHQPHLSNQDTTFSSLSSLLTSPLQNKHDKNNHDATTLYHHFNAPSNSYRLSFQQPSNPIMKQLISLNDSSTNTTTNSHSITNSNLPQTLNDDTILKNSSPHTASPQNCSNASSSIAITNHESSSAFPRGVSSKISKPDRQQKKLRASKVSMLNRQRKSTLLSRTSSNSSCSSSNSSNTNLASLSSSSTRNDECIINAFPSTPSPSKNNTAIPASSSFFTDRESWRFHTYENGKLKSSNDLIFRNFNPFNEKK